ncbi:MAG: long-chain fatty acid--CoA ligase [Nitrospirota bacterium]|jgi:long-chain acyl-CoA synthetase
MTKGVKGADHPWYKVWPGHLSRRFRYPRVPAGWLLERNLKKFADRTAVIFLDHESLEELERVTYGELFRRARALAAGLRELGVGKGNRVATLLPNSPAIITSYNAAWLAGAAITPCNIMAQEKELDYQLRDSAASVLIAAESMAELALSAAGRRGMRVIFAPTGERHRAKPPRGVLHFDDLLQADKPLPEVEVNPAKDMAVLLYTGGTTGEPKGAMLTHRNIVANTIQFARWYRFREGRETTICTIPMSHSGGMSGVMNVPLFSGATLVVMKRFKAASVARSIEKYRATRFFGVPTMYIAILNDPEASVCDLSSLRACRTNAAPLPVAVKEAFDGRVGKEVLVEGYGLTETSPLTHANPLDRPVPGSIGIPLPDTDCKIVDPQTGEDLPACCEGELVIRGPQVMKGYWNKPKATSKAMAGGWFHTGDVARMDEDGYFYIVDRMKDMINCGGYKVWPREVEEVLYAHPGVKLVTVIGVQDDYYGEIVKAFVVPGNDGVTVGELVEFCKSKMARYKVPRVMEFRDSLPISPQGKVLRRVMREEVRSGGSCGACSVQGRDEED